MLQERRIFSKNLRCAVIVCHPSFRSRSCETAVPLSTTQTLISFIPSSPSYRSYFRCSPTAPERSRPQPLQQYILSGYVRVRVPSQGACCLCSTTPLNMVLTQPGLWSVRLPLCGCVVVLFVCLLDKPCGARRGKGRQVSRGPGVGEQGAGCRGKSCVRPPPPVPLWVLRLGQEGVQ